MYSAHEKLVQDLVVFFNKNQITQEDIAAATGVHQSQVSRILKGQFKTLKGNAAKICNYAKITATATINKNSVSPELLEEINQLLDGTTKRERTILRLLKAIRNL